MNLAFYSEPIEKAIVEEIRQWSAEVLEQPSPYFNNLPACPYARSAWIDNKVSILLHHEFIGSLSYAHGMRFPSRCVI